MQPRLFFDIETLADPEVAATLPDPSAPANYKDADKIAAYVAEKRAKQLERAALDPDTGKVAAIALTVDQTTYATMTYYQSDEASMLESFWSFFRTCSGHCVGYNLLRFDLPFLLRRSMALGVKPGIAVEFKRYQVEPVTDLMAILYGQDLDSTKGLKWVAKRYGVPRDPQMDGVEGSMVKDLDEPTLRAYCEEDVRTVVGLFSKMQGVYFDLS